MKKSYSILELAERWGVHRATIYRMMARGELAYYRISATRRISADEVTRVEKVSQSVAQRRIVSHDRTS